MYTSLFEIIKEEILALNIDFENELNLLPAPDKLSLPNFLPNNTVNKRFNSALEFLKFVRNYVQENNLVLSEEHYSWIINDWGGIKSFKVNCEKNKNKIEQFLLKLLERDKSSRKLNIDLFSTISSLSKIASIQFSNKYFVYDSRVIYSINWLILKHSINNKKYDLYYFPKPNGRNQTTGILNLDTLIFLSNPDLSIDNKNVKKLYFSENTTYFIYCDLIKYLHKHILCDKPVWAIELLLFTIAPTKIVDDIINYYKRH